MDVDERDDASIRVAAGYHGKDGKQQNVGQLVELAFRSARIRNVFQQAHQRRKCSHGNLRVGGLPRSQTFSDSGIPLLSAASLRPAVVVPRTQSSRSGSVEQPWGRGYLGLELENDDKCL